MTTKHMTAAQRNMVRAEFVRIADPLTVRQLCSMCGMRAVVELSPVQLAEQPDDTTHVCHPMLRGCNHGFTSKGAV